MMVAKPSLSQKWTVAGQRDARALARELVGSQTLGVQLSDPSECNQLQGAAMSELERIIATTEAGELKFQKGERQAEQVMEDVPRKTAGYKEDLLEEANRKRLLVKLVPKIFVAAALALFGVSAHQLTRQQFVKADDRSRRGLTQALGLPAVISEHRHVFLPDAWTFGTPDKTVADTSNRALENAAPFSPSPICCGSPSA